MSTYRTYCNAYLGYPKNKDTPKRNSFFSTSSYVQDTIHFSTMSLLYFTPTYIAARHIIFKCMCLLLLYIYYYNI